MLVLESMCECNLKNNIPEGKIDGPNWNDFVLDRTIYKSSGDIFNSILDESEQIHSDKYHSQIVPKILQVIEKHIGK